MNEKHQIEFCSTNLAKGTKKVVKWLRIREDTDLYEFQCLGHCRQCAKHLFAVVDDQIISGQTPKELYEKIIENLS